MKLYNALEFLQIEPSLEFVYFHIDSQRLSRLWYLKNIFDGIDDYFGKSTTVCMPSFPFSGADYMGWLGKGQPFDILKTPCRVNLAGEVFRRKTRVSRSLHPWCSVACRGPAAHWLTSEHSHDTKTFGSRSPFHKIASAGGYVIGLGVDCNTNSFAHLPDDSMLSFYDFNVYAENNVHHPCIDADGNRIIVETDILAPGISKRIKPRLMKEHYTVQPFYREYEYQDIPFYAMKLDDFVTYTVKFNIEIAKETGCPLYYQ